MQAIDRVNRIVSLISFDVRERAHLNVPFDLPAPHQGQKAKEVRVFEVSEVSMCNT